LLTSINASVNIKMVLGECGDVIHHVGSHRHLDNGQEPTADGRHRLHSLEGESHAD
jgi:hypothetical protein